MNDPMAEQSTSDPVTRFLEGALRPTCVEILDAAFDPDGICVRFADAEGAEYTLELFGASSERERFATIGSLALAYRSNESTASEAALVAACQSLVGHLERDSGPLTHAFGPPPSTPEPRDGDVSAASTGDSHKAPLRFGPPHPVLARLAPAAYGPLVATAVAEGVVLVVSESDQRFAFELFPATSERDRFCESDGVAISYFMEASSAGEAELAEACPAWARALSGSGSEILAVIDELNRVAEAPPDRDNEKWSGEPIQITEQWLSSQPLPPDDAVRALFASRDEAPPSAQLYLDTPCAQACIFCGYAKSRLGDTEAFRELSNQLGRWNASDEGNIVSAATAALDELRKRVPAGHLFLTGNDCLRHPHIDALLALFAEEHEVPIGFSGPLTRLSEPEMAEAVASLPTLSQVTISLFSLDPAVHEATTGAPGSHAEVLAAIDNLIARGVSTDVNVVVTQRNLAELPDLLTFLAERGAKLQLNPVFAERSDYAESSLLLQPTWPLEELLVSPVELRASLDRAPVSTLAQVTWITAAADCALPHLLRTKRGTLGFNTAVAFVFLDSCEGCARRDGCVGVGPDVARMWGEAGVAPE